MGQGDKPKNMYVPTYQLSPLLLSFQPPIAEPTTTVRQPVLLATRERGAATCRLPWPGAQLERVGPSAFPCTHLYRHLLLLNIASHRQLVGRAVAAAATNCRNVPPIAFHERRSSNSSRSFVSRPTDHTPIHTVPLDSLHPCSHCSYVTNFRIVAHEPGRPCGAHRSRIAQGSSGSLNSVSLVDGMSTTAKPAPPTNPCSQITPTRSLPDGLGSSSTTSL